MKKSLPISQAPVLGLDSIFGAHPLFEDADRDGYPDRLRMEIAVDLRVQDAPLWAGVVNLAARLAGEVLALDGPVVRVHSRMPGRPCLWVRAPSARSEAAAELGRRGPGQVVLSGSSAAVMGAVLDALALGDVARDGVPAAWAAVRVDDTGAVFVLDGRGRMLGRLRLPPAPAVARDRIHRPAMDLLHPETWGYEIPESNPRERRLKLSIEIEPARLSPEVGIALSELATRAALQATALELPLVWAAPAHGSGVRLRVRETGARPARVECATDPDGSTFVQALGQGRELARCLEQWALVGFAVEEDGDGAARFRRTLVEASDLLTGTGAWGAWSRRLLLAARDGGPLPPVSPAARPRVVRACRMLGIPAPPVRPPLPVLRLRERWTPETRRILDALAQVPDGTGDVQATVLASRPEAARRRLARTFEGRLRAKGYRPRVSVLNAYKPGLSWLLEVVRPALEGVAAVGRVELSYRPFRSLPGALEMETRFLQEAYPGPDLLAAALGRPPETIDVRQRADLSTAYRARAWDRQGRGLLDETFTPFWSDLPYLPNHPELGRVHPSCSGFRLVQQGRVLAEHTLPTDRELFWSCFQERWLPAIETAMRRRLAPGATPPGVFWEELRIEVAIDETDRRLGTGEERVAPLEALHEDLYFVLLDFFREFGRETGLGEGPQFGRIVPRVLSRAPAGGPVATLSGRPQPDEDAVSEEDTPGVRAVGFATRGRSIDLTLSGGTPARDAADAGRLKGVARAWGLDVEPSCTAGAPARARLPIPSTAAHPSVPRAAAPKPPLDRRIPGREIEGWCRQLGTLPGLRSRPAGCSWQGRRVWAVEAALPAAGAVSVARLRLLKPTLLVNARHHANEVSSTNAALRLLWELGATAWGRRVLARVNAAVVPLENADGVATLEELLPDAPDHKLHAARYNALGVEWYAEYFRPAPRFPEARVKPALWRRWLPMLVLDAHGVPSHEWEQPFSGYAPGRFRAYWVPRAFIYAILPFIEDRSHPGHGFARVIAGVLDRALGAEPDIQRMDRELKDRYHRYARAREPQVFPPAARGRLTVLPSDRRLTGLNFGVQRFPVTLSEIVTEVADEVVSGPLLALCARAHLAAAKGLLEFLARRGPGRLARTRTPGGGLALAWEPGHTDLRFAI